MHLRHFNLLIGERRLDIGLRIPTGLRSKWVNVVEGATGVIDMTIAVVFIFIGEWITDEGWSSFTTCLTTLIILELHVWFKLTNIRKIARLSESSILLGLRMPHARVGL